LANRESEFKMVKKHVKDVIFVEKHIETKPKAAAKKF
jgi:hypothetical protein